MPVKARCTPFKRAQRPDLERRRRRRQRLDQLIRALVAFAALADAAVDDLFQMIAAGQRAHLGRADPRVRIAFDQHPEQLPDLIDIVSRLPLRRGAGEDVARRHQRVQGPRGDATPVALLPDDAEIAKLEAGVVAHEDVHRRQIAMQHLPAMKLAEHLQDAGDLPACGGLVELASGAVKKGAQVAMPRVLEGEAVERPAIRLHDRETRRRFASARGWSSSSWPK